MHGIERFLQNFDKNFELQGAIVSSLSQAIKDCDRHER